MIDATGTPITGTSRRHEPLTAPVWCVLVAAAIGRAPRARTASSLTGRRKSKDRTITSSVPTALSRGAEHFALTSQVD